MPLPKLKKRDENKSLKDQYAQLRQKGSIEDFEYLLHHIEVDENDEETIHHCYVYDHIGNLFEQGHLVVRDGKIFINGKKAEDGIYHVITGLEPDQDICWSDEEAEENDIKPKKMKAGMKYKEKSEEW